MLATSKKAGGGGTGVPPLSSDLTSRQRVEGADTLGTADWGESTAEVEKGNNSSTSGARCVCVGVCMYVFIY